MSFADFKKNLHDNEIEFIDFRFTDISGKWHHITYSKDYISEDLLKNGVMFDCSSIVGWDEKNQSDVIILPDIKTSFIDPFSSQPTLILICDLIDPNSYKPYTIDPRSVAKSAEEFLLKDFLSAKAFFEPELEFFIFDNVKFLSSSYKSLVNIYSEPLQNINPAKKQSSKSAHLSTQPIDAFNDIRSEIFTILKSIGIDPVLHHHSAAPSQAKIGIKFDTLTNSADNILKYKYIVRNVVHSYNKTATFMPKPLIDENGSGMNVRNYLQNGDKSLFAGTEYSGLSDVCLYYIGGILKHSKALNAFTNPTTNSYKRFLQNDNTPSSLSYSNCSKSSSIKIPNNHNKIKYEKNIEVRFPDPTANPYLAFSAILLAGIDGIKNKIHPGCAYEEIVQNNKKDKNEIISSSLVESLENLDKNRSFLTKNNVFSDDLINFYIKLKKKEILQVQNAFSATEFELYYNT